MKRGRYFLFWLLSVISVYCIILSLSIELGPRPERAVWIGLISNVLLFTALRLTKNKLAHETSGFVAISALMMFGCIRFRHPMGIPEFFSFQFCNMCIWFFDGFLNMLPERCNRC